MRVEGMRYSPMEIFIMKGSKRSTKNNRRIAEGEPKNKWLKITLKEGKKNEIRNVMKALGLTVSKLVRVSYGPFKLCSLPVGRTRPAFDYELEAIIKNFKKQNNKTLN
ncbi:MAG: hypothetical protein JJV96_01775 [Alphaproteobacteria bacterium]|nr:hypothetical protein [Alphaproteobacteria bacterium]